MELTGQKPAQKGGNYVMFSTQSRNWLFTRGELEGYYRRKKEYIVKKVSQTTDPQHPHNLTYFDEIDVIRYLIEQTMNLCIRMKMPLEVEGTALTFLRRLCLKHPFTSYHTEQITWASVFLAAKTEEYSVRLDVFGKIPKASVANYPIFEKILLESTHFETRIFSCLGSFLPFEQFVMEHNNGIVAKTLSQDERIALHNTILVQLRKTFYTDLMFLYPHGLILLAVGDNIIKTNKKWAEVINLQTIFGLPQGIEETFAEINRSLQNTYTGPLTPEKRAAIKQKIRNYITLKSSSHHQQSHPDGTTNAPVGGHATDSHEKPGKRLKTD